MADVFVVKGRLKATLWILAFAAGILLFGTIYHYRTAFDPASDHAAAVWRLLTIAVAVAFFGVWVLYLISDRVFAPLERVGRKEKIRTLSIRDFALSGLIILLIGGGVALKSMRVEELDPFLILAEGQHAHLEQLLAERPDMIKQQDPEGRSLLSVAIIAKDSKAVNILLDAGMDLLEEDGSGTSPLMLASGEEELFVHLLKQVGHIEAKDPRLARMLVYAVGLNRPVVVHALLEKGVSPNAFDSAYTPVMVHAAGLKAHGIIRDLLAYKGVPDMVDPKGHTALHVAAQLNDVEALKLLIGAGGDVNALGHDGFSVLHSAASKNAVDVVRYLLEEVKMDPDFRGKRDLTALQLCAMRDHQEIALLLLDHGADVNLANSSSRPPLALAERSRHLEMEKLLRSAGATDAYKEMLRLVELLSAIEQNDVVLVRKMLQEGVDVNGQNRQGISPLHMAVYHGHQDIAVMLIKAYADADLRDENGKTPLYFIKKKGFADLMLMIGERKDPEIKP